MPPPTSTIDSAALLRAHLKAGSRQRASPVDTISFVPDYFDPEAMLAWIDSITPALKNDVAWAFIGPHNSVNDAIQEVSIASAETSIPFVPTPHFLQATTAVDAALHDGDHWKM
jgi:hypothetical protein